MPLRTILAQFLPSVISSAIMSIAVGSVLVLTTQWSALGILLLAVPVGAITYVIALWWLEREVVLSAVGMIRSLVIRRAEVTVEAKQLP